MVLAKLSFLESTMFAFKVGGHPKKTWAFSVTRAKPLYCISLIEEATGNRRAVKMLSGHFSV